MLSLAYTIHNYIYVKWEWIWGIRGTDKYFVWWSRILRYIGKYIFGYNRANTDIQEKYITIVLRLVKATDEVYRQYITNVLGLVKVTDEVHGSE